MIVIMINEKPGLHVTESCRYFKEYYEAYFNSLHITDQALYIFIP